MRNDRWFQRARSARRFLVGLAAVWFAASACGDAAPADDRQVATLSQTEVVALCDELRDALDDQPVQCSFSAINWVVPSNQSCRDADLTSCTASVGDVRAWHEQARSDPCSVPPDGPTDDVTSDPRDGCDTLVPEVARPDICRAVSFSSLQTVDGVYELVSSMVPDRTPCDWPLPAPLDRDAPRFVLVATQASGVPEVILKSCVAIADCQTLGRELREFGEPLSTDADGYLFNHFTGCPLDATGSDIWLVSRAPAGVPSCQAQWLPTSEVWTDTSGATISTATGLPLRPSPGCGYVVALSIEERDACGAGAQYESRLVSPL